MSVIAIAYGDGFGPEAMEAALTVLREAGATLEIESIEIGSRVYAMGSKTGIRPSSWKTLQKTGVLFMGPVLPPEGLPSPGNTIRERMGDEFSLFEAEYGPEAWKEKPGRIDPSPMIRAGAAMLAHLGQAEPAERIHFALERALAEGCHLKARGRTLRMQEAVMDRLWRARQESNLRPTA